MTFVRCPFAQSDVSCDFCYQFELCIECSLFHAIFPDYDEVSVYDC